MTGEKSHKSENLWLFCIRAKAPEDVRAILSLHAALARHEALRAFHFFKHLEYTLGRLDEKTLECLAQATALEGVTTRAFDFCHNKLRNG